MVHLNNGVLVNSNNNKKQWNLEIRRQMDGTRRNHPEWGNPVTKRQAWYVLTHIWISDIEQRSTSLQSTPPEKLARRAQEKNTWSLKKEKGKHSSAAGGSAKMDSHFGNQYGDSSGKWESVYPKIQPFLSWVYTQRVHVHTTRTYVQPCSYQHCFEKARTWKQPRCPSTE